MDRYGRRPTAIGYGILAAAVIRCALFQVRGAARARGPARRGGVLRPRDGARDRRDLDRALPDVHPEPVGGLGTQHLRDRRLHPRPPARRRPRRPLHRRARLDRGHRDGARPAVHPGDVADLASPAGDEGTRARGDRARPRASHTRSARRQSGPRSVASVGDLRRGDRRCARRSASSASGRSATSRGGRREPPNGSCRPSTRATPSRSTATDRPASRPSCSADLADIRTDDLDFERIEVFRSQHSGQPRLRAVHRHVRGLRSRPRQARSAGRSSSRRRAAPTRRSSRWSRCRRAFLNTGRQRPGPRAARGVADRGYRGGRSDASRGTRPAVPADRRTCPRPRANRRSGRPARWSGSASSRSSSAMLAIDLFLFHREAHEVTTREAGDVDRHLDVDGPRLHVRHLGVAGRDGRRRVHRRLPARILAVGGQHLRVRPDLRVLRRAEGPAAPRAVLGDPRRAGLPRERSSPPEPRSSNASSSCSTCSARSSCSRGSGWRDTTRWRSIRTRTSSCACSGAHLQDHADLRRSEVLRREGRRPDGDAAPRRARRGRDDGHHLRRRLDPGDLRRHEGAVPRASRRTRSRSWDCGRCTSCSRT